MFWASAVFFVWSFSLGTDWASKRAEKKVWGLRAFFLWKCCSYSRNSNRIISRAGLDGADHLVNVLSRLNLTTCLKEDAALRHSSQKTYPRPYHSRIVPGCDALLWEFCRLLREKATRYWGSIWHHFLNIASWCDEMIEYNWKHRVDRPWFQHITQHYEDLRTTLEDIGNDCDNRVSLGNADVLTMLPIRRENSKQNITPKHCCC